MKIFITGSSDGIGQLAALKLIEQGHEVFVHARNSKRSEDTRSKIPRAERVLIADLTKVDETIRLAKEVNEYGTFDAIIHNAGIYRGSGEQIFTVNCLAPYILTSLIRKPKRLIYISSGMHSHTTPDIQNLPKRTDYSTSKLYILMLSNAVARKWPATYSNTVNPGWVPTKMGGASAPDDLQKGAETQVWLSVSNEDKAKVSGKYFFHQKETNYNRYADDITLQEKFLEQCEQISGIHFP